jgi:hypothetical protein
MGIISVRLMGGLGNMLFEISTAYATSIRDNKEFVCSTINMSIPHKPYTEYINNIFRKITFSGITVEPYFGEYGFHYTKIPKVINDGMLSGYFQSEKYFINYRENILNLFEIDEVTKDYLLSKYGDILNKDTCSIHVRRGDYLGLPEYHPVLNLEYYKNSINIIGDDKHYLIFSDDINWCEENFKFIKNKTIISDNLDYQDLYLMSFCKNNIIANSSFSWWGAWLNNNINKKVIIPKLWFGPNYSSYNTNDLYCQDWIKM